MIEFLKLVAGWIGRGWHGRERYQAIVTWKWLGTPYGEDQFPVIVIQSIHDKPINVTRLKIYNGFRFSTSFYPYNFDDPRDFELPRRIEPMSNIFIVLSEEALIKAQLQSRLLDRLRLPRVYIRIETMGGSKRMFVAERGLPYNDRRRRFQN